MPEKRTDITPAVPPWAEALATAWERLIVANEALAAVNETGSREWSRVGMRVVHARALAFAWEMEQGLKETEG